MVEGGFRSFHVLVLTPYKDCSSEITPSTGSF